MMYYKKTEEGEWIKYEERTWLAVLSWICLIAVISLSFDRVNEAVSRIIQDGHQTLIFVIGLFVIVFAAGTARLEPNLIRWRHKIYDRPDADYTASNASGIFTAPYPKWFKIRKVETKRL